MRSRAWIDQQCSAGYVHEVDVPWSRAYLDSYTLSQAARITEATFASCESLQLTVLPRRQHIGAFGIEGVLVHLLQSLCSVLRQQFHTIKWFPADISVVPLQAASGVLWHWW